MISLEGIKVAVIATDGYEYSELVEPVRALKAERATVHVIAPKGGEIKGWQDGNWSLYPVRVDKTITQASPTDYDALVLPGGVINPDQIRTNEDVLRFIKVMMAADKPVAAICHGPQILINAEVVSGRKMTSFHTVRKDLENAGAIWEDSKVVVDNGLITSRNPDDLPAFNRAIIEAVGIEVPYAETTVGQNATEYIENTLHTASKGNLNNEDLIEGLNELLTKNYDAESGYQQALEKTDSAKLKTFFGDRAAQRLRFGKEIKEVIRSLGGTPEKGTSLTGDLHRKWIDFRTALSSETEELVIEECERGEESSLEAYNEFLEQYALPVHLHQKIVAQRNMIQEALQKLDIYEEQYD
ncbi:MAG: DJ-1/PfpI/YhbO family deglycase/protease [Bacteroidota bacterium]